jgi:hypothetical protein
MIYEFNIKIYIFTYIKIMIFFNKFKKINSIFNHLYYKISNSPNRKTNKKPYHYNLNKQTL